jgi:AcrR family transcriptional regulator
LLKWADTTAVFFMDSISNQQRFMSTAPSPTKRTTKAGQTRAAILASARRAFAEHGYDGAGVRSIAAGAGVTAMMVNRYFGSKEGLFGEVVEDCARDPVILSLSNVTAPDIARAFAEALVGLTAETQSPLDGFLILFRSTSSKTAARIARERIAETHQQTARGVIDGKDADTRAAVFLSFVAGFQMMRQMIGIDALVDADPERLAAIITPVIAAILDRPSRKE